MSRRAKPGQRRRLSAPSAYRSSSSNPISAAGASIPAAAHDAPRPASPASITTTDRPRSASCHATPRPASPPPTTATSREGAGVTGVAIASGKLPAPAVPLARLALATLAAVACVVVAGVLAFHQRDGWGWFLLASLFFGSTGVVQRAAPAPAEAAPPPDDR